jgi:hypothetical protein
MWKKNEKRKKVLFTRTQKCKVFNHTASSVHRVLHLKRNNNNNNNNNTQSEASPAPLTPAVQKLCRSEHGAFACFLYRIFYRIEIVCCCPRSTWHCASGQGNTDAGHRKCLSVCGRRSWADGTAETAAAVPTWAVHQPRLQEFSIATGIAILCRGWLGVRFMWIILCKWLIHPFVCASACSSIHSSLGLSRARQHTSVRLL